MGGHDRNRGLEQGQGLIELALLLFIVGLVIIAAPAVFGKPISRVHESVAGLSGTLSPSPSPDPVRSDGPDDPWLWVTRVSWLASIGSFIVALVAKGRLTQEPVRNLASLTRNLRVLRASGLLLMEFGFCIWSRTSFSSDPGLMIVLQVLLLVVPTIIIYLLWVDPQARRGDLALAALAIPTAAAFLTTILIVGLS